MYSLIILEVRSLKSRCWQVCFLLEALRENLFCASLPASGVAGNFGIAWHIDTSLQSLPPSLCGALPECLCPNSSLLKRIPVMRLGSTQIQYDLIFTWLHQQKPCFQKQSHSEVLGEHKYLEDTLQPSTGPKKLEENYI